MPSIAENLDLPLADLLLLVESQRGNIELKAHGK